MTCGRGVGHFGVHSCPTKAESCRSLHRPAHARHCLCPSGFSTPNRLPRIGVDGGDTARRPGGCGDGAGSRAGAAAPRGVRVLDTAAAEAMAVPCQQVAAQVASPWADLPQCAGLRQRAALRHCGCGRSARGCWLSWRQRRWLKPLGALGPLVLREMIVRNSSSSSREPGSGRRRSPKEGRKEGR